MMKLTKEEKELIARLVYESKDYKSNWRTSYKEYYKLCDSILMKLEEDDETK